MCQFDDSVVVVDPVLSSRIGPRIFGKTVGVPRLASAPVPPSALQDIELLLVTHARFDHLDKPTLQAMAHDGTTAIVPVGCSRLVPKGFGRVIELAPGTVITVADLEVTAIEPNHWGARAVIDRRRGVNSYLVRSDSGTALFTGDTAQTDAFDTIERVDVAVFGIGAYDPWDHMHATPEQVWTMFQSLGARFLLPVHHSTFELSDEPVDEPMQRLLRAAGDLAGGVLVGDPGDVIVIGCGAGLGTVPNTA